MTDSCLYRAALTDVEMTLVRAAGRTVYMDLRESVWQYLALTQERSDTEGMHPCIPKDVLKRVVVMLEQHEKPKDVMAALKLEVNHKIMSLCKPWLTSLMESVKGNQHDSKHRRRIVLTLTSADYGNQDEVRALEFAHICINLCACKKQTSTFSFMDFVHDRSSAIFVAISAPRARYSCVATRICRPSMYLDTEGTCAKKRCSLAKPLFSKSSTRS